MPLSGDHSLPEDLYAADAVREIDRYVIDQQGVDGFDLMQAAAAGAFRRLVRNWPEPGRVLVLCGAGNNGDVFARDFQGRALRGPTRRAARLKQRARHRDPRR